MARDQKVLKLFIRLMLPVFALGGFGGVWGLVSVGENQQKTISSVWSQDGHYRASVVLANVSGGCGHTRSSLVVVERENFFIKTGEFTPFCFDGSPEHIALHWKDAQTLAIECSGCGDNSDYVDQNWGNLRFIYDLEKP